MLSHNSMQSEKQQNFYMFTLNNNRKINNDVCVREFSPFKNQYPPNKNAKKIYLYGIVEVL